MFTFVIWCIGLTTLSFIAAVNWVFVGESFEINPFLGLVTVLGSLIFWVLLLSLIFG